MAVQTYASISALLAPRISPRRTTVTRLFSASATASSPTASPSLSTALSTARPRALTHEAKCSHAGVSPARQRSSRMRSSPGITRQAPGHDTGVGRSGGQAVAPLEISCEVRHRGEVDLADRRRARALIAGGVLLGDERARHLAHRALLAAYRADRGRPHGGHPRPA